ncbi:MAG: hypothetical protein KBE91_07325 [Bacteroidia bacterium]|nr:hypothetical protein [Bacteroidia bacterium]MBP9689404.1 hypothetical protein [Bacteroidia bacterium]
MSEVKFELDEATKLKWYKIVFQLKKQFGKKPDMNGILFLIGMREMGTTRVMNKDERMDLFHIATCKLLSYQGYYKLTHSDQDGWPHYEQISKPPFTDLLNQEYLLRILVVAYFDEYNLYED